MKEKEITRAEKAIMFDVEFDTNIENRNIKSIGAAHIATLMPVLPY